MSSQEIQKLRRELEESRNALDAVTRRTSLKEYLGLSHNLCAAQLTFDINCLRNTRGGVTNPRDRITPTTISPWVDFDNLQSDTYRHLCAVLQDRQLFPNKADVVATSDSINEYFITSEAAITSYVNGAEVLPVKKILLQFIALGGSDDNTNLGVTFSPRGDPTENTETAIAPVDGVWNRGEQGSDRPIAMVELKPPHKLMTSALQNALDDGNGRARKSFKTKPIINSPHARNDSMYTITAVFTQVFDYMIESAVEFAYLSTGMACVFFRLCKTEPTVLYYSLYVPPRTNFAEASDTTVCQIALFLSRCLTVRRLDQQWAQSAADSNARFRVDPEEQLNMMSSPAPTASEIITPGKEDYKPSKKRRRRSTLESDLPSRRRGDSEDDADSPSPTRNRPVTRSHLTAGEPRVRHDAASSSTKLTDRGRKGAGLSLLRGQISDGVCDLCPVEGSPPPYCTQACLQGLTNGVASGKSRVLDMKCPNVNRHSSSSEHELTTGVLCNLLRPQLARDPVHAMEQLKIRGAIGHLFRITLCSHGYTFVAKAVRADHVHVLTHEYGIYEKLRHLQAEYIPVCLGLIQLERAYILPFPHHLTHLLLLSYSGPDLSSRSDPNLLPHGLSLSAKFTQRKLQDHGLRNQDVRKENLLWNAECGRVFMIDFEWADLPGMPDAPPSLNIPLKEKSNSAINNVKLQPRAAGKRKREQEDEDGRGPSRRCEGKT